MTTDPPHHNGAATKPLDIAIIGGGIGGLSLLLGLLHHTSRDSIRPHLYESAAAFSEIGAGVGFGPNSLQAMGIVTPKLEEMYRKVANEAETAEIDGEKVAIWNLLSMGMDGRTERNKLKGDFVYGKTWNRCFKKNIHRARFLDVMLELLPGGTGEGFVSFKKRCADIDDLGSGKGVKVHFADGSSIDADAVIGCDGVKSRVRHILLSKLGDVENIAPRFTGKYAYRGLIPMEEAVAVRGEVARVSQIVSGYNGHLVCFPIDRGDTLNVVAFYSKEKWERPEWVVEATIEEVLEDYKYWSQSVQNLLRRLRKPEAWAIFEHPPAKSYWDGEGKICLLGDCAHASSPHQGAGAGMAIEDAAVLSSLFGHLKTNNRQGLKAVLSAYDAVRRPRSQKLVSTSREAGEVWDFQKEGIRDDVEKLKENGQERMRWIWELDLNEHVNEAVRIMNES